MKIEDPFEVAYLGVTIKVTPIVNGSSMQYKVTLPTRKVVIEMSDTANVWREAMNKQETVVARGIGELIEMHFT